MKRRWRLFGALAATLLLGATVPLAGSTFLAMTTEEMVTQAEAVVQGRIIGLDSFWSEQGRLILTEAIVEVDEVLLGSAARQLRVRTAGGRVGDLHVVAHGFPAFAPGEEVILFLAAGEGHDGYRVLGYQQGHFRIVERLDGVRLAVPMVEEGARFFTRSGDLLPEPRSSRIEDFKTSLETSAQRFRRTAP